MKTIEKIIESIIWIFHIGEDLEKNIWIKRGDDLARKEGYTHLDGLEAIHRYIIDKHHWLPHQVRTLTLEDYYLILGDYDFFKDY